MTLNTSKPVSSYITGVSFGFLTSADVRALSAKRITNPLAFDNLLNPVPGGLYTPELGQIGDNACATCGLWYPQCPGHCGHIELPLPCYHPTYMDQTLRLLRAACVYCNRLKLSRVQVNRYSCKLKLVKYGLLKEVAEVDNIGASNAKAGAVNLDAAEESDSESENDADTKSIIDQRNRFVAKAIRLAIEDDASSKQKTEATTNARKAIVADFMGVITKSKKCANCAGIGMKYRKDRFVKIFRKALSEKERHAMIQSGHKARDPVVQLRKMEMAEKNRKRKRDADEGIADMDVSEESEEAEMEESEEEPEIAGGLVDEASETTMKTAKKIVDEEYLNPYRVLAQLNQLFAHDQDILSLVYGAEGRRNDKDIMTADMFFIKDILVPPTRFRPEARVGNKEVTEAQENTLYSNILNICDTMVTIQRELSNKEERDSRYRARTYADLEQTWTTLQDGVNSLIDRDRNPIKGPQGRRNPEGIKQKLEKKEGMFRKYMMGKRVNFAARTVISPDPNIESNEIGVPPVFARKLTYPEPVTQWNLEELQEAVRNGAHQWPGAAAIESETGQVMILDRKNAEERVALANSLLAPGPFVGAAKGTRPKKVYRHLNNGDIVIMNRQPTLHKPSMMCHRARVLPGEKTLRMHYANCNTYNADFDGDEMNMHFPQNENARAEALQIADTDHQYLSATAGNPLRGLIQDHISMGVYISNRDTMFERGEYMQLLYAALRPEHGHCASGRVETVPPAIFKPKPLWTGKQVITSVLKNITPATHEGLNMAGKSTTSASLWGAAGKEENNVIFKDGYLCSGIMDKKQIGPSSGGLVNAVYEIYGHTVAGRLLSVLGRLLTRLESMRAFSCGVEDLIFTKSGENDRKQALEGAATIGLEVTAKYVGLEEHRPKSGDRELRRRLEDILRDDAKLMGLDQITNSTTAKQLSSKVTDICLPAALIKPFPKNQMQAMTMSGAKGSKVNANQISCNLGQQVLEGRRVPIMVSGKTLPCFKPFETSIRAGGYVVDRFLTGVRPQEYYFHAMAGREGLIDTAVKTSRSGYLQRCLIKGMEGLKVEYDTTVRDADGTIVQFLYGEDGLDVAKAKYLTDLRFSAENHLSLYQNLGAVDNWKDVLSETAIEHNRKAEKQYRRTITANDHGDLGVSDPALSVYTPSTYVGSTSESMYRQLKQYADDNSDRLITNKKKEIEGVVARKNFERIINVRYMRSLVEPGEAVGVVAGQSVGEPSTQMTLNTFHLAGHAAKNVTLGIPRLREIVMTAAKNNATPTMTLRLHEDISLADARTFAKGISRLSLAEVLDKVTVTETTGKGTSYPEAKQYQIKLELFPKEEYNKEYAVTVEDVAATLEHRFLPRLQALTRKELKKRGEEKTLKSVKSDALPDIGKSAGTIEQERGRPQAEREGGDDDSDAEGDDDATRDKVKSNKQQAGYEAFEDDEENDLRSRQRTEAEQENDEAYGGSPADLADSASESDSDEEGSEKSRLKSAAKDREDRIRSDNKTHDVTRFSFNDQRGDSCTFTLEYDSSTAKILMLNLVELAAHSALIQSVDGVSAAMLDEQATKDANAVPIIATSGVNLRAMWDFQHIVNPRYLYTNNVHEILTHYGVEAARDAIVRELQGVFGGHGISVDPRHLMLIADYMTRDGRYQAFSRMGYRGNVSPFMKMSFETTVGFLRDAVLERDDDDLGGPSARIVVGALGKMGTGGFDVYTKVPSAEDKVHGQWRGMEDADSDVEMAEV
nr:dna-directed rna polymerase i subunit rpa1 [Quercus suber]